ncbi:MAG: 1-deoxy-D-xylulose-5-phosphate reductoisomerase [Thermodesulfobacteriota bacterium]|nr:1-deoxy-D-xylulose-5-phosphate reductoisomerase [Thermodesulfobacteriota bacterium]
MKRIVILGSTGSIGTSALDVIRMHPDRFDIAGLSAHKNTELLARQARAFHVDLTALTGLDTGADILGPDAAKSLITQAGPDIVLNAIGGAAGFMPSITAVEHNADLALANKESLVTGGSILMHKARETNTRIIPVDSEHSAIFQCLQSEAHDSIRRLILTASGGPFRDRPKESFKDITPKDALQHPTWSMGRRITIDSATMMNKALEIIEASWLFDIPVNKIDVWVHPQSIVHSMVEFNDKGIKAQMGRPDMRVPIGYALSWPERMDLDLEPLDFKEELGITFFKVDNDKFPAVRLAAEAMEIPHVLPCVMNAADEIAVDAFLKKRLRFDHITQVVEKTMQALSGQNAHGPEELIELDRLARVTAEGLIQ